MQNMERMERTPERMTFILRIPDLQIKTLLLSSTGEEIRLRWTTQLKAQIPEETLQLFGIGGTDRQAVLVGDIKTESLPLLIDFDPNGAQSLTVEQSAAFPSAIIPSECLSARFEEMTAKLNLLYCWPPPPTVPVIERPNLVENFHRNKPSGAPEPESTKNRSVRIPDGLIDYIFEKYDL